MPKSSTDYLVELILSMSKAEKRFFKLHSASNSGEPKFVTVFNFIDRTGYMDEVALLKKQPEIEKAQLSNLKAHLYKQLLSSIKALESKKNKELQIREQLDYATILYNKGFYHQALRQLEKAKSSIGGKSFNLLALEIVEFEKKIEAQYITRSLASKSSEITLESNRLKENVTMAIFFSNLSLELYALYLKVGFVRDEKETLFIQRFFESKMIDYSINKLDPESKMHLFNALVWYNYITQNFLICYKYAKLWVDLFEENPGLMESRQEMYLKGQHNLLSALFHLRDYKRFRSSLGQLEKKEAALMGNENVRLLYQLYYHTNVINLHYLKGTFSEGLTKIDSINKFIDDNSNKLDEHRIIVLYYKIACLYFGSGDNKMAINYLNKVIQFKEQSLREDIQCFARILNLIAHFELGNDILVEYQIKSVYRFLIKMGDLKGVQKEIFTFLRQLPFRTPLELKNGFLRLLNKLQKLAMDPYEKRPFLYLDIISWLECKLENRSVQEVIQEKAEKEQITGERLYFPKAR